MSSLGRDADNLLRAKKKENQRKINNSAEHLKLKQTSKQTRQMVLIHSQTYLHFHMNIRDPSEACLLFRFTQTKQMKITFLSRGSMWPLYRPVSRRLSIWFLGLLSRVLCGNAFSEDFQILTHSCRRASIYCCCCISRAPPWSSFMTETQNGLRLWQMADAFSTQNGTRAVNNTMNNKLFIEWLGPAAGAQAFAESVPVPAERELGIKVSWRLRLCVMQHQN